MRAVPLLGFWLFTALRLLAQTAALPLPADTSQTKQSSSANGTSCTCWGRVNWMQSATFLWRQRRATDGHSAKPSVNPSVPKRGGAGRRYLCLPKDLNVEQHGHRSGRPGKQRGKSTWGSCRHESFGRAPRQSLRVALSAASPRAVYRAVGFPLQSLTRMP